MKRLMLCLLIVLAAAFMLLPSAALAGDLNDLIAVVTYYGLAWLLLMRAV